MTPPNGSASDNQAVAALRENIRNLGDHIDSYKAGTAGAMGAGVFLLLLALGGAYDLVNHNTSISDALGISHNMFRWLVYALGVAGSALLVLGFVRQQRRDHDREARLAHMQEELACLEAQAETRATALQGSQAPEG
jgi:hypothetical protein